MNQPCYICASIHQTIHVFQSKSKYDVITVCRPTGEVRLAFATDKKGNWPPSNKNSRGATGSLDLYVRIHGSRGIRQFIQTNIFVLGVLD